LIRRIERGQPLLPNLRKPGGDSTFYLVIFLFALGAPASISNLHPAGIEQRHNNRYSHDAQKIAFQFRGGDCRSARRLG